LAQEAQRGGEEKFGFPFFWWGSIVHLN